MLPLVASKSAKWAGASLRNAPLVAAELGRIEELLLVDGNSDIGHRSGAVSNSGDEGLGLELHVLHKSGEVDADHSARDVPLAVASGLVVLHVRASHLLVAAGSVRAELQCLRGLLPRAGLDVLVPSHKGRVEASAAGRRRARRVGGGNNGRNGGAGASSDLEPARVQALAPHLRGRHRAGRARCLMATLLAKLHAHRQGVSASLTVNHLLISPCFRG
mmetsp:Transcript_13121/g.52332  ORF Transcript_13121/g.52332 Transcript_13121/m.52332 type:complete len:218 (-) Transcript_13121:22-675(-)